MQLITVNFVYFRLFTTMYSNTSQNDVSKDELNDDGRQKRDVIDLYSMVKCATGCDPLIFKG